MNSSPFVSSRAMYWPDLHKVCTGSLIVADPLAHPYAYGWFGHLLSYCFHRGFLCPILTLQNVLHEERVLC